MKRIKLSLPSLFQFTASTTRFIEHIIKSIPKFIWTSAAITGLLVTGALFGYDQGVHPDFTPSPYEEALTKNEAYKDVISGYEKLSQLYYEQGENVAIVTDQDMYTEHPEEVIDALRSMDQYKDMINIQYGRIMELRRTAGLSDYNEALQSDLPGLYFTN